MKNGVSSIMVSEARKERTENDERRIANEWLTYCY